MFLFLFKNEVVVRANLPEGGLETVRIADETEEIWNTGSGAEEEWDGGGIHRVQNHVFLTRKLFKNCSEKNKRLYHFLTLGFLTEI